MHPDCFSDGREAFLFHAFLGGKHQHQVRLQDAGLALASLATSALGSKLVWNAFRGRYAELHDRFSDTGEVGPDRPGWLTLSQTRAPTNHTRD